MRRNLIGKKNPQQFFEKSTFSNTIRFAANDYAGAMAQYNTQLQDGNLNIALNSESGNARKIYTRLHERSDSFTSADSLAFGMVAAQNPIANPARYDYDTITTGLSGHPDTLVDAYSDLSASSGNLTVSLLTGATASGDSAVLNWDGLATSPEARFESTTYAGAGAHWKFVLSNPTTTAMDLLEFRTVTSGGTAGAWTSTSDAMFVGYSTQAYHDAGTPDLLTVDVPSGSYRVDFRIAGSAGQAELNKLRIASYPTADKITGLSTTVSTLIDAGTLVGVVKRSHTNGFTSAIYINIIDVLADNGREDFGTSFSRDEIGFDALHTQRTGALLYQGVISGRKLQKKLDELGTTRVSDYVWHFGCWSIDRIGVASITDDHLADELANGWDRHVTVHADHQTILTVGSAIFNTSGHDAEFSAGRPDRVRVPREGDGFSTSTSSTAALNDTGVLPPSEFTVNPQGIAITTYAGFNGPLEDSSEVLGSTADRIGSGRFTFEAPVTDQQVLGVSESGSDLLPSAVADGIRNGEYRIDIQIFTARTGALSAINDVALSNTSRNAWAEVLGTVGFYS